MDGVLKRVLDYKLVFDCLADESNGMVLLQVLSARWPRRGGEETEEGEGVSCSAVMEFQFNS